MPLTQRRTAVADKRYGDAVALLERERHGHAGHGQRAQCQGGGRRQHTPLEVAGVQVLAVHGGTGLAHLRAQHHRHSFFVVSHRQRHAEVANHRREDIAAPGTVRRAIRLAAMQPNGPGIDGFLAERSKAFALERHVAPANFAAHEELLQAIVDAARQAHALENFLALGLGQRRLDGSAPQEAIAGVHDFGARLFQALDRGSARGGFGNALGRGDLVVQRLGERAAERGARRIQLHGVAGLDGANARAVERFKRNGQGEGVALCDKRAEPAGETCEPGCIDRA